MEKVRYMISDAANIVNVESHVLRYWEDELELNIPRNEMGHRYYTKENIQEFQKIKELKEQGYQLKAIRMIVHSEPIANAGDIPVMESGLHQVPLPGQQAKDRPYLPASDTDLKPKAAGAMPPKENIMDNTDKMAQFTELMTEIVGKALAANNQALSKNISEDVGEQVIKEMNYLMREREEAEEERFRKLDEAIRNNMRKKEAKKEKKEVKKVKWGKKRTQEPENAM